MVLYPRAGSKVDAVSIPPGLPPGGLRQLIDLRVSRVESLRPGVTEGVLLGTGGHTSTRWRETLDIGAGVEVLARYADAAPALVRQGRTRYLAGWFSAELQRLVLEQAAIDAGLSPVRLPDGLRLRRRGDLLFAFNYGDQVALLDVPQAQWLVGSAAIAPQGIGISRRLSS